MVCVCHYLGGLSFDPSPDSFIHHLPSRRRWFRCECGFLYVLTWPRTTVQLLLLHVCIYSAIVTTAGTTAALRFQLDGYAREDLIGRP